MAAPAYGYPPPVYGYPPVPPVPGYLDQAASFIASNAPTIVTIAAVGLVACGVLYGKDVLNWLIGLPARLMKDVRKRSRSSSSDSDDDSSQEDECVTPAPQTATAQQQASASRRVTRSSKKQQQLEDRIAKGVESGVQSAFQKLEEKQRAGAVAAAGAAH